ncbi:peptide-methionine (S)-S-oxide reductase MsrA [Sphingomonas solaris]|uniref:Peptide methionine sulfoxide reductase MsrA n=1 Tax=Alterirhizorhabdus solaris TaxID=2529389 RepID=A0A558QWS8_9SPHN|nr:peptide-methionine (S)-S-oxide reductase MsrA [Sphingomonas solaris]TVV71527.1 peptide-methionine (S)-S-oxide reductase MsrA [Sphingomonas solaris]
MTPLRIRLIAAAGAALLAGTMLTQVSAVSAAAPIVRIPAPALDAPSAAPSETAVFAGGCFWGVQGVYQRVKGVTSAVSGYTGGTAATAQYETVGGGDTGHAEAVKITYDPRVVSYGKLLQIYFSVVADPTELNRQGPDSGTQYRSAIFPTSEGQRRTAAAYIAQLGKAGAWQRPIVTKVERSQGFFPAEGYHQDYLTLHPDAAYIRINDLPKVAALKQAFPTLYRATPVLVRAKG